MAGGDTGTGWVLEQMVGPALGHGGYAVTTQAVVGLRPGGGKHMVDAVAAKDGRRVLVSLKWQQVSGTAEQKVPFEVICLAQAVAEGGYDLAYLVLGGEGWKLRTFYTSGGLDRHLVRAEQVRIVTLEGFIAQANLGRL